jgi:hypothetical protein
MTLAELRTLRAANELQRLAAKRRKAERLYEANVRIYGGEEAALRSMDSRDRDDAVEMLTFGIEVFWRPLMGEWV